jgi:hypothetical protein
MREYDAPEFKLSTVTLNDVFEGICKASVKKGDSKYLYGQKDDKGEVPVQYSIYVDPGVAQNAFHPNDRHTRVKSAVINYQTESDVESIEGEPERQEFATVSLELEMLSQPEISIHEYYTVAKVDGVPDAYVDIEYSAAAGEAIRVGGLRTIQAEDTFEADFTDIISGDDLAMLRRPLVIEEIEAMQLLTEAYA